MTEINVIENKIKNFGGGGYSLSDNGRGEKTYVIRSEDLKGSLRDIIHPAAYEGQWQVKHTLGKNIVEYTIEKRWQIWSLSKEHK